MAIEASVQNVARQCLTLVLEDALWIALGWKRRPKHGALVQRLRAKWKVQLEKTYLKELVILLSASELKQRPLGPNELRQLIGIYADGVGTSGPLWHGFGYSSREEATSHLEESINLYLRTPLAEWQNLGFQRVGLIGIPDRALMVRLALGTNRVLQNLVEMTHEGSSPTRQRTFWRTSTSDATLPQSW